MADEENPMTSSRPGTSKSQRGSRPPSGKSQASRPSSTTSQSSRARSSKPSRPGSSASRPGSNVSQRTLSRLTSATSTKSAAWTNDPEQDFTVNDDAEELIKEDEPPPKGCWHSFTNCIGGMWATREMEAIDDREVFVRTTIRELVVYSIFLVVLCILTFGMTSATMFYYTKVMSNLFESGTTVSQVDQFWTFMENDMLDGLYWEYLYNDGSNKNFVCPGGEEAVGPCPVNPADRNILYENRLLGLPRLRQIRVTNDSCDVHEDFQNAIKQCYNTYSSSIEDKSAFGNGYRKRTSAMAWKYSEADVLGGADHSGILTSYSGAGSIQDLHSLKNESAAIIKELKEGLWITRGTRFASVDFTVYNANINLFCIVKLTFEFPATGGILPFSSFRTVKLLRYVTAWDFFILACELIFCGFIFYYIIEEGLEIRRHKYSYFKSVWNILDLTVIIISGLCIFLNLYTNVVVEAKLQDLLAEPDQYADFTSLGSWSKQNNNAVAICVFFAWIKLFKYISFNKTMTQLSSTLSRCAKDVAGFGVMFFIVFFAFAQLGYLLFGTQVKDFSSFADAIFTLLRTILGDFDFSAIEQANRVLGPIFFLSYVFFVFFVLLNMFLAIINDTYSEVKAEIAGQKNEFEIGDYMKRGYNNVLGKMGARNKNIDIENALKLSSTDGTVTYDEVRQNLKKCNFSDMEIEMFFARYDKNGKFEFNPNETNEILEALEDESDMEDMIDEDPRPKSGKEARALRSARIRSAATGERPRTATGNVGGEQFGVLCRRVDRMEHSIGSIVTKIDAVLIKLESMEKGKTKRKATMSKILGAITEDDGSDDATRRRKMEDLVREELQHWEESSRPSTSESAPPEQK
eukprot:maker-scaffold579_size130606-snap-gene-0.31 protein:Tk02369 transcript:maker-scaffold579_size130606-snap-gene-0.31-mRNA-1 annotation:"pkd2 "